ncbi:hypothetical protein D3C81_1270560 [compost metagenome]
MVVAHQGTPGGKACGGQRGRFGVAVTLGRQGEGRGTRGDLRTGVAIQAITGHPGKPFDIGLAVEPVGEEGADNIVTHLEFADAGPHRRHFTGTVGHGDAPLARPPHAADHGEVVVVEGTGVQTHGDLAGLWRRRLAGADLDFVVAAARLDVDGLAAHGWVSIQGKTAVQHSQCGLPPLWEQVYPRKGPHCQYTKNQPSIARNARQSAACQSTRCGHGLSGKLTSTVRAPAARPQSRSKR